MTHIRLLIAVLLISTSGFAQILKPVHWTWKAEKIKGDEYKLVFTAVIDKPWHTYGMYIQDGGPVKTSFTFDKNADVQLTGKMTESGTKAKEMLDDVFQVRVKLFEDKATFEQVVKAKKGAKITGGVEFMACDDKSCLAPETKKFEIVIP